MQWEGQTGSLPIPCPVVPVLFLRAHQRLSLVSLSDSWCGWCGICWFMPAAVSPQCFEQGQAQIHKYTDICTDIYTQTWNLSVSSLASSVTLCAQVVIYFVLLGWHNFPSFCCVVDSSNNHFMPAQKNTDFLEGRVFRDLWNTAGTDPANSAVQARFKRSVWQMGEKSDISTNFYFSLLSTFLALWVLQTESKKNNKKEWSL